MYTKKQYCLKCKEATLQVVRKSIYRKRIWHMYAECTCCQKENDWIEYLQQL